MNEQIINPMWIYIMDVASDLDISIMIFSVLATIGLVIGLITYITWLFMEYDSDYEDDIIRNNKYSSILKKGIWTTVLLFILAFAIPSKQTMYAMFVSSYITEENINKTTESITDTVDYIFDKIDELND